MPPACPRIPPILNVPPMGLFIARALHVGRAGRPLNIRSRTPFISYCVAGLFQPKSRCVHWPHFFSLTR